MYFVRGESRIGGSVELRSWRDKMVNTKIESSEKWKKALDFYESGIIPGLTSEDEGRYIVIDAETQEWEIGDTEDVTFTLWDRTHSSNLVLIRHPNISTGRLGFHLSQSFK